MRNGAKDEIAVVILDATGLNVATLNKNVIFATASLDRLDRTAIVASPMLRGSIPSVTVPRKFSRADSLEAKDSW